jgi:hypothetical protein
MIGLWIAILVFVWLGLLVFRRTISANLLGEIRGCLKPAPGEPSAFEGSFEERAKERAMEK